MKRMTKQRKAILKCLSESDRPLNIEEIQAWAADFSSSLNLSTVYRTIKKLLEENHIIQIVLPGEKTCYEIPQQEHHHYFSCDGCSKTFSIKGCPKGLLDLVPKGFYLQGHSIVLNGFCLNCTSKVSPLQMYPS